MFRYALVRYLHVQEIHGLLIPYLKMNFVIKIKLDVGLPIYLCPAMA